MNRPPTKARFPSPAGLLQCPVKIMKLTEAQFEKQVCDYLAADGWICRKMEQNYSERKRKRTGEKGMPDRLCIRYRWFSINPPQPADTSIAHVMWIEFKRDKTGHFSQAQNDWHTLERKRGALTLKAGEDFPATVEGFKAWYGSSGLQRRP